MKRTIYLILFIIYSKICISQNNLFEYDSTEIILCYNSKYIIPNIKDNKFKIKNFNIIKDTLKIDILPSIDTLYIKNKKCGFYFDYYVIKSNKKSRQIQTLKIPSIYCKNIKYLLIESEYMVESYIFKIKNNKGNFFYLIKILKK